MRVTPMRATLHTVRRTYNSRRKDLIMAELGDIQIPDELLKAIAGGVLTPTTEKHLIELAAFSKRGATP